MGDARARKAFFRKRVRLPLQSDEGKEAVLLVRDCTGRSEVKW